MAENQTTKLLVKSIGRDKDFSNSLCIYFNRPPTNEEMRMIDDFLHMMVDQSDVMEPGNPGINRPIQ
jgi:hypothetical protein